MQTPTPPRAHPVEPRQPLARPSLRHSEGFLFSPETLTWLSGLVLSLSTFMSWYSGSGGYRLVLSVIGWHTGLIGQIVFFLGLAVLMLVALRIFGVALPASLPESLIVIGIGVLSTILVMVRLIWIPDRFLPADGRGIGIWIALLASFGVIAAGLIEASEEV
ncbi:MAG: hypothetical protein WBQ14_03670 [Gaiellaceae bacterium]